MSAVTDSARLRDTVEFLWQLLDEIDTAGDIARDNDAAYRQYVERLQRRRHERVTTDGYGLFMLP